MATFTDKLGRTWEVEFVNFHARKIERELKLNLRKPDDQRQMFNDPDTFDAVLTILLADQIKAANLTDEDVSRGMNAATVAAARRALLEELLVFTHPETATEVRASLPRVIEEAERAQAEALRELMTRAADSLGSSANSPALPESPTPGGGLSAT